MTEETAKSLPNSKQIQLDDETFQEIVELGQKVQNLYYLGIGIMAVLLWIGLNLWSFAREARPFP